ncbi:hypothetical protein GCM10022378_13370 [Salinicoccus jeotgali]|uniref:DUF393 domain-containing protein n=1 Tax=Salinicoccus jeotgali TaxID=381634 RepID=A0ABP7ETN6_9STAP
MNILYFDDDCIICNRFAKIITSLDRKDKIRFQSIKTLDTIMPEEVDSLIYYSDDIYIYSDAVIEVLADTTGFKPVKLMKVIPICWRNALYKLVAANRHRVNRGKSCTIDPDVRSKIVKSTK